MTQELTLVNGNGRATAVFEYCQAFIEKHGRGPKLSEIAQGTDLPSSGVVWSVRKLREQGVIEHDAGNYASMRILTPRRGRGKRWLPADGVAGLLPPRSSDPEPPAEGGSKVEILKLKAGLQSKLASLEIVIGMTPEPTATELAKLRPDIEAQIHAIDVVVALL